MTDITIDPAKGKLTVRVSVTTPQVVAYETTVFASDGTTVLEKHVSDSQTANPWIQPLPNDAASYKDCFISTNFAINDPAGGGNPFNIDYSIQQQNRDLDPVLHISGNSTDDTLNRGEIFHVK